MPEICNKNICIVVISFMALGYLLYSTAQSNCNLKSRLSRFENKNDNTSPDNTSPDNIKNDDYKPKDPVIQDRFKNSMKNIASKGVKAYAKSNNLEEIPKFL